MKYLFAFVYFFLSTLGLTFAQTENYEVRKAVFSSDKYDEFSPVFYKNGIVFVSNRTKNEIVNYSDSVTKGQFKIYYMDTVHTGKWTDSRFFSSQIRSKVNDGPATFNKTGDTVYFSRNILIDGPVSKISGPRNKLGIFSAVFDGKKWGRVKEFRFNNEWYNITTPCLSPDGLRLYFASDQPGGFGGSDLYYCEWKEGYWHSPVNLGPKINTTGNEAYPFINRSGGLFFSSDGIAGLGGKDIFFTQLKNNEWQTPVALDYPINSKFDDLGLITDDLMTEGYFSSNRGRSMDIYKFKTNYEQIFYCNEQRENNFCFAFRDTNNTIGDNKSFQFKWDFGDGKSALGINVSHCYTGPGKFPVKLDLMDIKSGKYYFTKLSFYLTLKDIEQPYINSANIAVAGDTVAMDALKSVLPGFEVVSYSWDMGDSTRLKGPEIRHIYNTAGSYNIKLGVVLKQEETGIMHRESILKTIRILENREKKSAALLNSVQKKDLPDFNSYDHALIEDLYSADNELSKECVFNVEVINSKVKLDPGNNLFKNLPSKYTLREVYYPSSKSYSYIIDCKLKISEVLLTFNEIKSLGFNKAAIRTYVLTDPAEKELYNLKKIYGLASDDYFDSYNKLTSAAYQMLDQLTKLIGKYPEVKLVIEVNIDDISARIPGMDVSVIRAQIINNYLLNKKIDNKRFICRGMGTTRPIEENNSNGNRKLNRRIDIQIIK